MNTTSTTMAPAAADTDASEAAPAPARARPGVEANKLAKRLHRQVGQAIVDYRMIERGDKGQSDLPN